jgi:hypothetical protein
MSLLERASTKVFAVEEAPKGIFAGTFLSIISVATNSMRPRRNAATLPEPF